ncbi:MAG TPA: G8 domain-containing protein [Burkholderiaceae bacterium]|nr:G8 domain-containing protein [Burkholderiaceae bacterium]
MGYLEFLAAGAAPAPAPAFPEGARRWSDEASWDDGVPDAGARVRIEAGRTVVLDQDVDVASLEIEGTLLVEARDTRVRAGWILVHKGGRLAVGSPEQPFRDRLTITLCARDGVVPHSDLGTKFLAALDGGTIDLHGQQRTSWVQLGSTVAPGHSNVRLAQPVDWRAGERIAIVSGQDHALVEERTIRDIGADCMSLTLDQAVAHRHHGQQGALRVQPGSMAKALLLERNIVVEGCEDSARESVGGFCMIAGSTKQGEIARRAIGRFSGIEFRRMGQFNRPGRYPLHWHNNGDAAESCVSGCLVQDSYQRGIVTVGSRHVRISGNVVMKPYGHGYIVESEDNSPQLVTTNLAVRPRVARFADTAMRRYCELRPRAFWIVRSAQERPAAH